MKKFKPSFLTLSLMAAGLSLHAVPTFAQETDNASQADDAADVEVIQVKGFRSSLIKSLNTKRFSDTVVDAISADDIGGLPDVSIADALTRIPGVTSIRIDGQSGELNIRGLSGNYVFSTFNGREMVSASGGRTVQFDQFPSELISQAQVYKSQKASLIEGGVAGTVELRTANALDMDDDRQIRVSVQGSHNSEAADNPDSGDFGSRLTLAYKEKFMDETVGVSLGYARLKEPTVSSRFVGLQFDRLSPQYDGLDEFRDEAGNMFLTDGFELNEQGGENKRDSFVAAFDYVPTDNLKMRLDGFYSEFDDEAFDRGFRVQGLNRITDASQDLELRNPVVADGAIIGGQYWLNPNGDAIAPPFRGANQNFRIEVQADDNTTESEVLALGFNLEYQISDMLSMSFDLAHASAEEVLRDRVLRLALFEDSSVDTPIIENDLVVDYQLNGLGIPSIGFNQDFTDVNKLMVVSAESYPFFEENESNAAALDFTLEVENDFVSSLEWGVRYSERTHSLRRGRFVHGTTDQNMRSGRYITYTRDDEGNFVESQRFQPFRLTQDMVTVHTLGGDLGNTPSFLTIDNSQVLDAWLPDVDQTPIRNWDHSWSILNGREVEEDVTSAYLMANLNMEIGDIPVTGNVGIRVVHSDQRAFGLSFVGGGAGDPIADDRGVINNDFIRTEEGIDYTDYLPSFNLNFQLTDSDQLRLAYAKVLSREDLSQMGIRNTWRWETDTAFGNTTSLDSSTSPQVLPFYADQFDISYEHYFTETDGALTIALWHKEIENDPVTVVTENYDFEANGFNVPPAPDSIRFDPSGEEIIFQPRGTYSRALNVGDAGYFRGFEIAYTQTFSMLPDMWKGLGININYSYTDSDVKKPTGIPGFEESGPEEGLSPNVWSATAFYDYDEIFEIRINARYRDDYLNDQISIGEEQSAFFKEETIWSAQASYNYSENLQFFASMDNITDEENVSFFGRESRTGTIQFFGRTMYFGLNYNL